MTATPGLPSVGRRTGTAGTFATAMKTQLTRDRHPLTTRSPDDPAIALVDAWAEVLDVLAFYSGRIADEGYLRTAAEPLSVVELARTVGYVPGRGRAAATLLAFTLEESPGSPPSVRVPRGTRVASLPGPEQVPQTYETTEDLLARPEWNAVPARSDHPQECAEGDTGAHLKGVRPDLRAGAAVLLVGAERERDEASDAWAFRLLAAVETDPGRGASRAQWAEPLGEPPEHSGRTHELVPAPPGTRLHVLRLRAGIFGSSAPDFRLIDVADGSTLDRIRDGRGEKRSRDDTAGGPDWPGWSVQVPRQPSGTVDLDGLHPGVVPGSWLVLSRTGASVCYRVTSVQEVARTDYTLNTKVTRVRLAGPSVAASFGSHVRETTVHAVSERIPLGTAPELTPVDGDVVRLGRAVPVPPANRTVVVRGPRPVVLVAEGVHELALSAPGEPDVPLRPGDRLEVLGSIGTLGGPVTWLTTRGSVTAAPGELHMVPPEQDAVLHSEVATTLAPDPGATLVDELRLTAPLAGCYDPGTARVLANVAAGGHGETHEQVLGSGDAARTYQRFTLAGAPLSYVAGARGQVVSTLTVRVDGRLWTEVPRLFGTGPDDEVFVTEVDDSGGVTVRFGDGRTGARLPSGTNNVTAGYRVGTGVQGRVETGQLTLLMTRPLGVRAVTNPRAAATAADPEPAEDVREGTAHTALTLERVVSLRDVEDFARSVPGIGKALAVRVWDGRAGVVHLTVTGPLGDAVDEPALAELEAAVRAAGAPRLPLAVQAAELVPVRVTAAVVVDPAYDPGEVLPAAAAALTEVASAGGRHLGEAFRLGDLVVATHGVPGVLAVRVSQPERDVRALAARHEAGGLAPAQLVSLGPDGLELTAVTG
jgi:hypothetical protein